MGKLCLMFVSNILQPCIQIRMLLITRVATCT